jgi:hypothetical protein
MNCDKEQHINANKIENVGWILSHGFCIRHFIVLLKQENLTDEEIEIKVTEFIDEAVPCSDLSDPKNKKLLKWMHNPTPRKKT